MPSPIWTPTSSRCVAALTLADPAKTAGYSAIIQTTPSGSRKRPVGQEGFLTGHTDCPRGQGITENSETLRVTQQTVSRLKVSLRDNLNS